MSILTEEMEQQLADLREHFDKEELTEDELSTLMLQAIETETEKPMAEINDAWLTACGKLMAYVDHDKLVRLPERSKQIRSELIAAIHKEQKAQKMRIVYHVALAAACFLLVLVGVSFSMQWFRVTQSSDEQVYNLSGQQMEIHTGNQATADGGETWRECETTSFQELCDFLNYIPQVPTWVPQGWVLNGYYATTDGESQSITAVYEKAEEKNCLIYDYKQAENISTISVDFYQDGVGETLKLDNGLDIYMTTNTDELVAVWMTPHICASVAGPVTVEELKTFILGIQ